MNDLNDLKNRLNDPDNYDIIIYNYIINIIYKDATIHPNKDVIVLQYTQTRML